MQVNLIENPRRDKRFYRLFNKSLTVLSGCALAPGPGPTITPADTPAAEIPIPQPLELFERYTVVGIGRESSLNIYQNASADSPIVGQIPSFGTDILPSGNFQNGEYDTWELISHQESIGWVDKGFIAEQHGTLSAELILMGHQVLEALKTGQYSLLDPVIQPELCLRFSPYSYLNEDNQLICPTELGDVWKFYSLGAKYNIDGTGKPINLTFNEYHQQFVYDQDYIKPSVVGFNVEVSSGNSINNIQEIYPDGIMIEYHFPGIDPRYGGMDWRSLRLVFVPGNDQWYLVAIIHGEWTI